MWENPGSNVSREGDVWNRAPMDLRIFTHTVATLFLSIAHINHIVPPITLLPLIISDEPKALGTSIL